VSPQNDAEPTETPESSFGVWLIREVVALVFVAGWLCLFAIELFTGRYTLPFWVHCCGIGALSYALGLNAAQLVYRPPSRRQAVRRVVGGSTRGEEEGSSTTDG
jgi:hypothetical protein